jgi:hypothetical protein
MYSRIPSKALFGDGIEHRQQLACSGKQGNLLALASGRQSLVTSIEDRVVSDRRESCHIQGSAPIGTLTHDAGRSTHLTGVSVQGHSAHQCGDAVPVELAQFGKLGKYRRVVGSVDARHAGQRLCQRSVVVARYTHGHLGFAVPELLLEELDDSLDVRAGSHVRQTQAPPPGSWNPSQLAPAWQQGLQLLKFGVSQWRDEAFGLGMLVQHASEEYQHARIQRIGLGQCVHYAGEVARRARIDHFLPRLGLFATGHFQRLATQAARTTRTGPRLKDTRRSGLDPADGRAWSSVIERS